MVRRTVAIALVTAALIVAAAVLVWTMHVNALRGAVAAQAAVARVLLQSDRVDLRSAAQTLAVSGIHAVVEDRQGGLLADAHPNEVIVRPFPPGGEPGNPLGPPPRDGPPQDGPPREGPPPERPARPAPAIDTFAAQTARIPPSTVRSGPYVALIAPEVRDLSAFLVRLAIATLVMLVLDAGVATYVAAAVTRAEHARLEAVAEERRAAATEFQRFLADAGHELRTPLTIVSGYVDILAARGARTDPELKRMYDGMRAETARMRALVEKMLLLARLETPVSVPRLVDLSSVADEAAEAMRARFPGRDVVVTNDDASPVIIDQDDLYEAVHNLIENAIKYAPKSTVSVRTGERDGRAFAEVSDDGPGIEPEEQRMIFNRFYRGNGRSDAEGSGLGLAIVARVAERWGGSIALDSRPGRTTFTLAFPLADEERRVVAAR